MLRTDGNHELLDFGQLQFLHWLTPFVATVFVAALPLGLILIPAHAATTQTGDRTKPFVTGHQFEPGPIVNGHNRQPTQGEIEARTQELRAQADAGPTAAIVIIKQFNDALPTAMRSGPHTDFSHRFAALAPEIDQTFDLRAVLAVSVGPSWARLPPDQQSRLLYAFRRYTVASYVANFNSYAGQSFTVSPETRSVGADRVVVQSQIAPTNGDATTLDYVMQKTPAAWMVVDVLAAGSISRVAVQRSDFRHILNNGGAEALLASLQRKTVDLSGGALA